MMSRPASTLYEQLTCSVCFQRYKDPRTLPCHHSFCKDCLERVTALSLEQNEEIPGEASSANTDIQCPCCCKYVVLPPGGVCELPSAFFINNLFEIEKQTTSQCAPNLQCKKHERIIEFYCNDCGVLLCSVCTIKEHRAHDCDLAADVSKTHQKVIEDQLALLRRDVAHVDAMIAHSESAKQTLLIEGDKTRTAITNTVENLHRHVEERKMKLMTIVDQNIKEKLKPLEDQRQKGLAIITQMRNYESVVERRLEKSKESIEFMTVKHELVQIVSNARLNRESIKFTFPNTISFSSNPLPSYEMIGLLFDPTDKDATIDVFAGRKYQRILYLPDIDTSETDQLVCHLEPCNKMLKSSECQIRSLQNDKYEVSFTPNRVSSHDLVMFPFSSIKKATIAQLFVNSPLLEGKRRSITKQIVNNLSTVSITKTGDLIVCDTKSDSISVLASHDRKALSTISSLSGSKKKSLNKPCCVGVTPDNCIIVIDSGKQCYRLLKIQIDGKLIEMTSLTYKLQLQSPNALAVHSSGEIFIVDSGAHSVFVFNSNLNFCRTFGGKGKAHGYFDQPHSIAFDSAGSAYVSDTMNDRIQKFSALEEGLVHVDVFRNGSENASEVNSLKQPTAFCISCFDTLFVIDKHRRIAVIDTSGCLLGEIHYSKLLSPISPCAIVVSKDESFLSVLDSFTGAEALYTIQ